MWEPSEENQEAEKKITLVILITAQVEFVELFFIWWLPNPCIVYFKPTIVRNSAITSKQIYMQLLMEFLSDKK